MEVVFVDWWFGPSFFSGGRLVLETGNKIVAQVVFYKWKRWAKEFGGIETWRSWFMF